MGNIDNSLLVMLAIYGGAVLIALWFAMVIWTYRDMRARSRDTLAQIFVTGIVAVLNLPGLLVYILLRPRETLSEAYERSLEEEALLQEIEEKPSCPGCGQRVQDDWQVCAYCHTRLKKSCVQCSELLELPWNICPYCASEQVEQRVEPTQHVTRYAPEPPPPQIEDKWLASGGTQTTGNVEYPQYVDDEY